MAAESSEASEGAIDVAAESSEASEGAIDVTETRRSALAWGAVATLLFYVGLETLLLVGVRLPLGAVGVGAIGLAIGAAVAVTARYAEPRIARKGRN